MTASRMILSVLSHIGSILNATGSILMLRRSSGSDMIVFSAILSVKAYVGSIEIDDG